MQHKSSSLVALFDVSRKACGLVVVCLAMLMIGCSVSSGHKHECEEDNSINLDPIIGLFGMAVDGDDKDDYEHFFDDKCKCKRCR